MFFGKPMPDRPPKDKKKQVAKKAKIRLNLAQDRKLQPVDICCDEAFRVILTGASGSGKTYILRQLLKEFAQLGPLYQAVIFNPKVVGFRLFEPRFHVLPLVVGDGVERKSEQFAQGLNNVYKEMMDRYTYAYQHGLGDDDPLPIDDLHPHILVVVDEVAELLTGKNSSKSRDMLFALSSLSRQASMSLVIAGQHLDAQTLDTKIKANMDNTIIMRVKSGFAVQTVAPEGTDIETDCPAHQIPITKDYTGVGYFMTNLTDQRFVKARGRNCSNDKVEAVMAQYAKDKRDLPWLYKGEIFDELKEDAGEALQDFAEFDDFLFPEKYQ